ncbi:hypothetical protein C1646_756883 [Rhizophagus diaphanus]|nr:hypothetical protein C1646_756883 [Rhizophagus diaphanus] [Rhizophagus sp. MUCL 43196]
MSDNESISSDDSNNELFNKEFLQNIPDDSDSSNDNDCFKNAAKSNLTLKLEPILDNIEWMPLYRHLKLLEIKHMLRQNTIKKFIMNKDLYKVIYNYHKTKAQESNDMSRLLVHLEKLQALMDCETKDAYVWLFQCILNATGLTSKAFVIDADSGMDIVIYLKYSSTFHVHYWEIFERCWSDLLIKYPAAENYLKKVLYSSKAFWACAFNIFLAVNEQLEEK